MYLFSGCVGVGVGLLISDCPIFRYGRTCYLKIECVCVGGGGGGGVGGGADEIIFCKIQRLSSEFRV